VRFAPSHVSTPGYAGFRPGSSQYLSIAREEPLPHPPQQRNARRLAMTERCASRSHLYEVGCAQSWIVVIIQGQMRVCSAGVWACGQTRARGNGRSFLSTVLPTHSCYGLSVLQYTGGCRTASGCFSDELLQLKQRRTERGDWAHIWVGWRGAQGRDELGAGRQAHQNRIHVSQHISTHPSL
jgi:hypothetical protein